MTNTYCLQKRMFLKTKWLSISQFDLLFFVKSYLKKYIRNRMFVKEHIVCGSVSGQVSTQHRTHHLQCCVTARICLAAGGPIYLCWLVTTDTINIFESNKDANNANLRLYDKVSFGVWEDGTMAFAEKVVAGAWKGRRGISVYETL